MRRRAPGFTLIEVLVVLVIVGLMASLLSLDLRGLLAREDERELRRLRLVIEAAYERAQVGGSPVLIELTEGGYRFATLDIDNQWRPLNEPPILSERRLPGDWRWGELQQLARFPGAQTRLLLDDEPGEFRLRLLLPNGEAWLSGDANGQTRIRLPDGKVL